jgi:hypothetical protein
MAAVVNAIDDNGNGGSATSTPLRTIAAVAC